LLLIHDLGVEGHADAHARVTLHTRRLLVRVVGIAVGLLRPVSLALDYEPSMAGRNKLLENGGELPRDLLECALDRLILLLVEMLNQRLDRLLRRIELLSSLQQLIALYGEAVVLVEGLLVDVLVLLEGLVDLPESRLNLVLSAG
jgi:hypothetical protein